MNKCFITPVKVNSGKRKGDVHTQMFNLNILEYGGEEFQVTHQQQTARNRYYLGQQLQAGTAVLLLGSNADTICRTTHTIYKTVSNLSLKIRFFL